MRILVIGSGGREHALVWKIAQSPLVSTVYCAPGNAGICELATCVAIDPNDINALQAFATHNAINLTVVGPEAPLIRGIVDRFAEHGLRVFGPSAAAAQLEGSKTFAKQVMTEANIPTAQYWSCATLEEARQCVHSYYRAHGSAAKLVLKADGLAAGKGVIIADNETEAYTILSRMMQDRIFGPSGDTVVIEEFLTGEEASIMVVTDGLHIVPFTPSQDHKRIFDGDQGPNTGGMGAYAPVPYLPENLLEEVLDNIIKPALRTLNGRGAPYQGVLYAGIMVTPTGPKTIEFNCRFGDPETQAVLPLLESDIVPLLMAATDGTLGNVETEYRTGAAVCVVAASAGYPASYKTDLPISGLDKGFSTSQTHVFHAGTRTEHGTVLTDGGRVLSVTGLGSTVQEARSHAYARLATIHFDGIQYRHDIAQRAITAAA